VPQSKRSGSHECRPQRWLHPPSLLGNDGVVNVAIDVDPKARRPSSGSAPKWHPGQSQTAKGGSSPLWYGFIFTVACFVFGFFLGVGASSSEEGMIGAT